MPVSHAYWLFLIILIVCDQDKHEKREPKNKTNQNNQNQKNTNILNVQTQNPNKLTNKQTYIQTYIQTYKQNFKTNKQTTQAMASNLHVVYGDFDEHVDEESERWEYGDKMVGRYNVMAKEFKRAREFFNWTFFRNGCLNCCCGCCFICSRKMNI